jgi:nucleoside-diphosphate-sugar epimerase
VVRKLLSSGHEVMALARRARLKRISDMAPRIEIIHGDLHPANVDVFAPIKAWHPEGCIHLAWYAEPGKYLDSRENLASLAASLYLLDRLVEWGCQSFVGAGTCAEYAESDRPFLEDAPTAPHTLYAACKLGLCLAGEQLAHRGLVKFAWGRIFYLYGEGEDERRMVPALIRALLENRPFNATAGEQIRDYLHVNDVAQAFVTMLLAGVSGTYNVASGQPISIADFMRIVGHRMNGEHLIRLGALPYRDWEPRFISGANDRLRALGWMPTIPLCDGIAASIGYWRSMAVHRPESA